MAHAAFERLVRERDAAVFLGSLGTFPLLDDDSATLRSACSSRRVLRLSLAIDASTACRAFFRGGETTRCSGSEERVCSKMASVVFVEAVGSRTPAARGWSCTTLSSLSAG